MVEESTINKAFTMKEIIKMYPETILKRFGHEAQVAGIVFNDDQEDKSLIIMLPDEELMPEAVWNFTEQEWDELLKQTDLLPIEILAKENGNLVKAIVRKTTRQIDNKISWNVYRRDNYTCRYCGRDDVPLTVDHIVLWEDGGPSTEENLVSACKKCNRKRGNTKYENWINGNIYKDLSKNLSDNIKDKNEALIYKIPNIDLNYQTLRGKKR